MAKGTDKNVTYGPGGPNNGGPNNGRPGPGRPSGNGPANGAGNGPAGPANGGAPGAGRPGRRPPTEKELEDARRRAAQRRKTDPNSDEYDEYEADRKARKKAAKGCFFSFLVAMGLVAAVFIIGFFYVNNEISGNSAPGPTTAQTTGTDENGNPVVTLEVVQGLGNARSIAEMLKENGLINNETVFRIYVRFFYDSARTFKYGTFEVSAGMSYDEMLEVLTVKQVAREVVRVTFTEGQSIMKFAEEVQAKGLCTVEEFLDAANNGDYSDIAFVQRLDRDPAAWMLGEGYLAPNTYDFYTDDSPYNIVRKLYVQMDKIFTEEMYARMDEVGLSLRDTINLASIVEREAGDFKKQPAVAQVFLNRMFGPLEGTGLARRTIGSDTTFFYLRDWVARDYGGVYENIPLDIRLNYLTNDNEANVREGLPVGPIGCPSKNAIEAVLWPEASNYYFFVSDKYGDYHYAHSYAEHEKNILAVDEINAKFDEEQQNIE